MRLRLNRIYLAATLLSCVWAPQSASQDADHAAQAKPAVDAGRCGVLVMAHGGSAEWNKAVQTVVAPPRDTYPIEIAFGMAKTSTLDAAVQRLEEQGVDQIAVVRMFISGESFLGPTEYILGLNDELKGAMKHSGDAMKDDMPADSHGSPMQGDKPADSHGSPMQGHQNTDTPKPMGRHMMEPPTPIQTDATFFLSKSGVAASSLIDDILIDRVRSLSLNPADECILILAHGPGDDEENKRWLADMQRRTELLSTLGDFVDIRSETLREDWPGRRAEAEERIRGFVKESNEQGVRVIVIPFRVAGFGPYARVLGGYDYVADGRGFCPHPDMTVWLDQTAQECLPALPDTNLGEQDKTSKN